VKVSLFTFLFLLAITSNGQSGPASHVITHSKVTVTTHPSGLRKFPVWSKFPDQKLEIRKILLHVTLGCPDTLPCAHWDYLDHITLLKQGGKNGQSLNYELGRMLTPYGSIYNKGWDFTWTVDVTDFSQLLRDSVEIEYAHSGYEPQTVGWALTVDFEITTGKPVLDPISIQPMWNGSFRYGDPDKPTEKLLAPIAVVTQKNSVVNRLRIQQTGHGMDKPKGCSEFCSRWREVQVDGTTIERKNLWKECGSNPLYPQGGTWIFDRGMWCPGDLQPADCYDLFLKPGEHLLHLAMEPYAATENIQANENIASYLVQYKGPNSKNDVAIEEILVPNQNKLYTRMNPANFRPRIVIRNLGSDPLNKVDIVYQTLGGKKQLFHWKGNLAFGKSEEVILPGTIEAPGSDHHFQVTLNNPNGRKDEWSGDNSLVSQFESPVVLPEKFVVQYLTNNHPKDNTITIVDSSGESVYLKSPEQTNPGTMYLDTLSLKAGKYELMLNDSAGNGLEFWYEAEQGFGYLRLLDLQGRLIKNFESDCGNGQFLAFTTSPTYRPDTCSSQYAFVLYPRMTKDSIALDYHSDLPGIMEVTITADGKLVERHEYQSVKQGRFNYNVAYLPKGRYILEAIMNGESKFKRRFNKQ